MRAHTHRAQRYIKLLNSARGFIYYCVPLRERGRRHQLSSEQPAAAAANAPRPKAARCARARVEREPLVNQRYFNNNITRTLAVGAEKDRSLWLSRAF